MRKGKKIFLLLMLMGMLFGAFSLHGSAANMVKTATTVTGGKWVTGTSGLRYKYAEGGYAKNVWLKIDGGVYYFTAKGYGKTGWFSYNGKRYYAHKKTGKIFVKQWKTTNGKKYYLMANGVKATSRWKKISGKYYYFNAKGQMLTSQMILSGGKTYYVDADGVRVSKQWITIGKKTYYFASNGVRVQGKWKKIKGNYYYFNSSGVLQTGQWIGDYYVDENGIRLTDCVVDGYTLDSTGKKIVEEFTGKYIFVGDSRTVGMASAVSASNTVFIGKVGMGLSWLKSTAASTLATYLNTDANARVIFAFGVNDLGNISGYITYYQTLIAKYPDTEFYMMAVNPVNETLEKKYGYSVTNAQISTFNTKLKAAFSSCYIDTYTHLTTNGFSTTDGIHYAASTYVSIYNYVMSVMD